MRRSAPRGPVWVLVASAFAFACSRSNPAYERAAGDGGGTADDTADDGPTTAGTTPGDDDASIDGSGDTVDPTLDSDVGDDAVVGDCPGNDVCLALPGPPWEGPVELERILDASDTHCPLPRFPVEYGSGHVGGLDVPDPLCCECSRPEVDCADPSVLGGNDTTCVTGFGVVSLEPCHPTADLPGVLTLGDPVVSSFSGCSGVKHRFPAPAIEDPHAICRAETVEPCDAGACFPANASRQCVVAPGDRACPGEFPQGTAVLSVSDERVCRGDSCDCTAQDNPTCSVALDAYDDATCSGVPATSFDASDSCIPLADNEYLNLTVTAHAPSCQPSEVGVDGTIDKQVEFTVCCA